MAETELRRLVGKKVAVALNMVSRKPEFKEDDEDNPLEERLYAIITKFATDKEGSVVSINGELLNTEKVDKSIDDYRKRAILET